MCALKDDDELKEYNEQWKPIKMDDIWPEVRRLSVLWARSWYSIQETHKLAQDIQNMIIFKMKKLEKEIFDAGFNSGLKEKYTETTKLFTKQKKQKNMEQLKYLNLTERDFKLMVDGLEELPNKGLAGEIMGELFVGMLSKEGKDSELFLKAKADREKRLKEQEHQKELLKEEVRILQGKLLQLKRFLMENKLLSDAYEIINQNEATRPV